MNWTALLQQLMQGVSLSSDQSRSLMEGWLASEIPPELSGAILVAWHHKGVSASELAAMAEVLQNSVVAPEIPPQNQGSVLLDTCGTGGDGKDTFNISTAVAFVAAAAGIPVAKHGNRAVSSRSGSADVLEALGINLAAPLTKMAEAVTEVGIAFLFAPYWHPALKAVAPLRRNLGIRTVFNLLGPLVNPLRPTAQILGVYHRSLIEPVAGALQLLGIEQAVVLHSREGLDEVGLGDATDLMIVSKQEKSMKVLNPQELGVSWAPLDALQGGDVPTNAMLLQQVLQGKGTPAQNSCVALNSALALQIVGVVDTWQAGLNRSLEILASGAPWQKLEALRSFLQ